MFIAEGAQMKNISVSQALISALENAKFTFEIPVYGKLIESMPINDMHDDLVTAWRKAARKLSFGAETHVLCNPKYRKHWIDFIENVAESVRQQKPHEAS